MRVAVRCCSANRCLSGFRAVGLALGWLAITLALMGVPGTARADNFTGYAQTGWGYDNKAYCCEDAIAAAQDDSARSCEDSGGFPDFRRNSARGRCDWESTRGSDGRRVYRCEASASVSCR
jgi:hypothetical protein